MFRQYFSKFKEMSLERLYKYSLYKRLIWCFVVVLVFPILVIGGYNAMYSLTKNQQESREFLEESSTQIANNISNYIYDHMSLLDEVAENTQIVEEFSVYEYVNWRRKSEIENHIRLVLGHTFGASGAIDTFEMISRNYSYFYYPSPISNGDFKNSRLLSLEAKQVLMTVDTKEVPSDRNKYVILTRGIYNERGDCLGNIVVALDLTYFDKVCYENVNTLLNEVMIIDGNNVIVSASDEALVGSYFTGDKLRSISIFKSIPNTELTVVNRIAMQTLLRSALIQFSITLFTAVVFAILALILALLFTKSVIRPINKLMKEMNKPEVEKYVGDNGSDEYSIIIESFNKMSGHIVDAIQGQYKLKLQEMELRELRKEAELSALQQQINPHFLYNTLECIYWNGQLEGDEEISEIVSALGNYLRVIIDKGREYVTVDNEVESVNNYMFLQNKRFGNRIIYNWNFPRNLKDTKILKLTLHPIVEDVIATNLDEIESDIYMDVAIIKNEESILFFLTGQSVTYYLERFKEPDFKTKGISSVDERLTLYYGDEYGVIINFHQEEIRVSIPVYKAERAGEKRRGEYCENSKENVYT